MLTLFLLKSVFGLISTYPFINSGIFSSWVAFCGAFLLIINIQIDEYNYEEYYKYQVRLDWFQGLVEYLSQFKTQKREAKAATFRMIVRLSQLRLLKDVILLFSTLENKITAIIPFLLMGDLVIYSFPSGLEQINDVFELKGMPQMELKLVSAYSFLFRQLYPGGWPFTVLNCQLRINCS